ncbi:TerD family protein [Zymomonas mobilis]|uniref:Tellurium resistance n=1 Tax=Zymomonas mobilis subsp. pomaceae (strain ATCC 29192 / DSM 22645 / JCM 10191 / CCUG 17912 / NBRC 13757 / NCIMB 11200 / NRRL B-4491 / Barker I) TaxID=579138 RepID=F8ET26_ZYMMT|nr:TerD family protein [Zymomonas mobilis]AEI37930.1 Tellurium resistance [Zymomonas mobilis subsp. pomaceae ATCC 29192]MDX5949299.1 TerD family protein [Zymomonas mobilis subsp. pomaceae]GEB89694.1 tellurium resistance protein TerA [Zymomonas mobilis subsp. pomaceae]
MIELARGQKIPLRDIIPNGPIIITVNHRPENIDIVAFGLTSDRKIGDDRYVILFSNPHSPDSTISFESHSGQTRFTIDVDRVPASIDRIVFSATNDAAPISKAEELRVSIGQGEAVYNGKEGLTSETAVMMLELYRHAGSWRIGAIGQGFNGGLPALITYFGGEIESPAPQQPSPPRLNLKKVTLEKKQSISLEKTGSAFGEIVLNLNWSRGTSPKRGFFGGNRSNKAIDLDLGCLYIMKDGQKGIVQALGNAFGHFDEAPYLELSGDDRTGDVLSGETIRINGKHFDEIQRVAVFALIYEGVPNWNETNGIVTITSPGQPPLEVRMTEGRNNMRLCGVALIDNDKGKMKVSRLVEYFGDQKKFADNIGIHLRWTSGSKD